MPPDKAMLEAHVRFEVDRWQGDRLSESVAEEVEAVFGWLGSVSLAELAPADRVLAVMAEVRDFDISDEVMSSARAVVASVRAAALDDDRTVADLVPREVFDEYTALVIRMRDARTALIDQITTSEVYSQLIAHVLYNGIKNYLVTESPIARRVPGASSLMRLGQNALSSAGLDKGIDRQLTSFVNSNISDSIRESKEYLDTVLDEKLLKEVADELWASNSTATVADAAALLSSETLAGFVSVTRPLLEAVRASDVYWAASERAVEDFYDTHGSRPVADVLADAGVTADWLSPRIVDLARPAVDTALADGFLEDRVRARLSAFYRTYRPAKPRPTKARPAKTPSGRARSARS